MDLGGSLKMEGQKVTSRKYYEMELQKLNASLLEMGEMIRMAIGGAVTALLEFDHDKAREIIAYDEQIDRQNREIEQQCYTLLLSQQPVAGDLRMVSAALKMTTDMERIGDHAADISEIELMLENLPTLSCVPIRQMATETSVMLIKSLEAFAQRDEEKANWVIGRDDVVDDLFDTVKSELIEAIRAGTTVSFREKYRKADALLIDDIQFIAGKESTQEEFFHTFNTLYESKKQIVLTSDRPPRDIATLEDRLKTRFEWGLTADVQPPDFETRMAIIKRKAELVGLSVPDNVCEFIAQKLKSNIRQLEGTVKKLNAIHLVEGATPTISTAQRAISDIVNNEQPAPVTVSKIIEEVGRTYGVSPEDIKSSKRNANVSFARQISMYVVREITQMPMVEIGKEFGGRDHSTVVYAIQQIEEKSARDPVTKATVSDIIKNIRDR